MVLIIYWRWVKSNISTSKGFITQTLESSFHPGSKAWKTLIGRLACVPRPPHPRSLFWLVTCTASLKGPLPPSEPAMPLLRVRQQVGLSGQLGDRGQLPSEEQSKAGGGEGWIWGSHRTGPYDRDKKKKKEERKQNKNTFKCTHSGENTSRDRTGEALRGRSNNRESEAEGGLRLLTHPGASGEKQPEKGGEEGDIIPLDLMDWGQMNEDCLH